MAEIATVQTIFFAQPHWGETHMSKRKLQHEFEDRVEKRTRLYDQRDSIDTPSLCSFSMGFMNSPRAAQGFTNFSDPPLSCNHDHNIQAKPVKPNAFSILMQAAGSQSSPQLPGALTVTETCQCCSFNEAEGGRNDVIDPRQTLLFPTLNSRMRQHRVDSMKLASLRCEHCSKLACIDCGASCNGCGVKLCKFCFVINFDGQIDRKLCLGCNSVAQSCVDRDMSD